MLGRGKRNELGSEKCRLACAAGVVNEGRGGGIWGDKQLNLANGGVKDLGVRGLGREDVRVLRVILVSKK